MYVLHVFTVHGRCIGVSRSMQWRPGYTETSIISLACQCQCLHHIWLIRVATHFCSDSLGLLRNSNMAALMLMLSVNGTLRYVHTWRLCLCLRQCYCQSLTLHQWKCKHKCTEFVWTHSWHFTLTQCWTLRQTQTSSVNIPLVCREFQFPESPLLLVLRSE